MRQPQHFAQAVDFDRRPCRRPALPSARRVFELFVDLLQLAAHLLGLLEHRAEIRQISQAL